jgi:tetratricopeptide (TPR) repeat protein
VIRTRLAIMAILALSSSTFGTSAARSRKQVIQIVGQIQKADYEGDRRALERQFDELGPFVENRQLASRVRYWRGFALWRRALNGANESVPSAELDADLKRAVDEFRQAASKDPTFVDARIASASCLLFRVFLNQADSNRVRELLPEAMEQLKRAQATAPENPRLFWVLGSNYWHLPPERGGGQSKAISTYQRGLELVRQQTKPVDPLEPAWGEPELLMNLSWSNLHKNEPDLKAAEQYARTALALIPYWHYVRDMLLPQIRASESTT